MLILLFVYHRCLAPLFVGLSTEKLIDLIGSTVLIIIVINMLLGLIFIKRSNNPVIANAVLKAFGFGFKQIFNLFGLLGKLFNWILWQTYETSFNYFSAIENFPAWKITCYSSIIKFLVGLILIIL